MQVLFLQKGTIENEGVVPSKRNNKKRKCCSFRKEQKKMNVLFLRKGIAENESVVPSEKNNKKVELTCLQKGTTRRKNCCSLKKE